MTMKAVRDPGKVGVPPRGVNGRPGEGPDERDGVEVHGGDEPAVRMADIVEAEAQLVLEMFGKLKDKRDGELRVSTRRNARTGIVEIIYIGAHERGDLSKLRRLYDRAARGCVTF